MQDYGMLKSAKRLSVSLSFAAATGAMSGCASFATHVNESNCTQQSRASFGIPFILEFGGAGSGTFNKNCETGYNIGVVPMLGQKPDGTLAPPSIIIFYKKYFEELDFLLKEKISKSTPEEAENDPDIKRLSEIKKFADYFLRSLSGGRLDAEKLRILYDNKITNPDLINPDGTIRSVEDPQSPTSEKAKPKYICVNNGTFRTCIPNPDR